MWSGHKIMTKDDINDLFGVMTTSAVGFSKVFHFQRYTLFMLSDHEKYKFFLVGQQQCDGSRDDYGVHRGA